MRYRRAGQPAAPTPLRSHRAVEVSTRAACGPGRGVAIRGLAELVDARQQTEAFWRETWAEELRAAAGVDASERRDVRHTDATIVVDKSPPRRCAATLPSTWSGP